MFFRKCFNFESLANYREFKMDPESQSGSFVSKLHAFPGF